ncbi:YkvA family protein [Hyphomonas sp.]|uniref:YkvA family protein n=1 Tax=Hyphomonas sp. TaxID=87 RepID=UPI0032EB38BF|tara:strand:+ start:14529 stop:14930 length:402 start_codon:yes stop_codon:yes gene_type:complete
MSDAAEIIQTIKGRDGTYLPKSIERNERLARGVIPKLMRVIGRVPFADDLVAAWYAARDPLTPMKAKAVLFAAVAYFVMPVDALPDIVVGLGFTDDATVLATALGVVGMYVKERHRRMARRLLRLPEPVKQAE